MDSKAAGAQLGKFKEGGRQVFKIGRIILILRILVGLDVMCQTMSGMKGGMNIAAPRNYGRSDLRR